MLRRLQALAGTAAGLVALVLWIGMAPMPSPAQATSMDKTLLFESAVHPWKIYGVREKPTWQTREHYYQVARRGQP